MAEGEPALRLRAWTILGPRRTGPWLRWGPIPTMVRRATNPSHHPNPAERPIPQRIGCALITGVGSSMKIP